MRKLIAHVLGVSLILGAAAPLAGCVVEARGSASAGGGAKHAKPKATKTVDKDDDDVKSAKSPKPKPVASSKSTATLPPDSFQVKDGALQLPGPVLFETGKDVLKPESDAVLSVVKSYLDAKPQVTLLRIEGHTDNVGNASDNQSLSERRSMAVARWLTGKGIKCKRLIPVGFGASKPVADNATAEGREQNRRTVFINAELKDKPIGGMPVDGGGVVAGDPCR